jgi:hypothetical protein
MPSIKKTLIALLVLFPMLLVGQELDCCQTNSEVENLMTGYWKIKDSPSKTIYHYWFNNGQGNVEDVIATDQPGKYTVEEPNHSFFYLEKGNTGFNINYVYKYGQWTSTLTYLDNYKMMLLTNGETTEYIRHTPRK